ncbi:carbohydrate ABC transporter permease [Cohnella nanjingensis]|uniref:Carbohydrate ABC transporter permease n=1 Tax=Cohnella nanjingensis TaxID=1387779 RepID=A0A7X0RKV3_9BACL|nr:carbohydrate ABC transporter permease [Cohnella nanjingensis]MBB6669357.1 carbohydrate ABC transporter permease [Cohnella nanjingensis]
MATNRGDRLFNFVNSFLLIFILLIVLYPMYFVLIASISNPEAVLNGKVFLIPKQLTLQGYDLVFKNKDILTGYGNTILYTVVGTALNLVMTVLAAYPLSRRDFKGRNAIMAMFIFTLFFSGGLIPTYLLIKQLSMLNTFAVMIVLGAVAVWNIIIMRTFFQQNVPVEVHEAASIDGCSNLGILIRVVIPLSAPILAVMVLFYSVDHWNAYFNALIFLSRRSQFPLQLILREILIQSQMQKMMENSQESFAKLLMSSESIKYAVIIIANLPIFLLYPFLQKYFVKGILIGAIKG